jgi:hypothetical protein
MKMILAFLLVSCAEVPLSLFADERADVFKELGVLKKDYRKRISEIRKAGNDELKTEQKKSYQAISAVGKGIEEHPGLRLSGRLVTRPRLRIKRP